MSKDTEKLYDRVGKVLKSARSSPQPGITFTPEKMMELNALAKALLADQIALTEHLYHRCMLHMLMLEYLVENPPPGRSATAAVIKCLRDYADLSQDMLGVLKGAKAQAGEGLLGRAGGDHVRGRRGSGGPKGKAT
jgi:hypothetical protein